MVLTTKKIPQTSQKTKQQQKHSTAWIFTSPRVDS